MKMFRNIALAGLVALGGSACADLEVTNLNEPDRSRAVSTPSDVEALIAGSFQAVWRQSHEWAPGPALSTMADEHTASWGNFGMQDASSEPRVALNNDPSYGYREVMEDGWTQGYRALSAIRDGFSAIQGEDGSFDGEDGVRIGTDGRDTPRAIAFGRIMQGVAMGYLGALYDQAFILDETTDIENANLQPYNEVMDRALELLADGIQRAESNSFEVPSSWVGGFEGLDNQDLAAIGHSFMARLMASEARTESERDAADWSAIASHAQNGYQGDFGAISNGFSTWFFDILKSYGGVMPIWARADMKTIGPADVSGNYEAWMALPPSQRNEFLITTPDRRVTGASPTDDGLWFQYHGPSSFRPERGTYHFSFYGDNRWWDYLNDPFMTGLAVDITERENDFLRAEKHLRAGEIPQALAIINKYRAVAGLPDATASGAPGGTDSCVPQMPDGSCADLWETFKYEKRIEVWHTGMGIAYFDDRGWGDLLTGTAIQLPVPGSELLTLLMDIYTFGGDGEGAAPAPSLREIQTGPITPEQIRARLEAYETFDEGYRARGAAEMLSTR